MQAGVYLRGHQWLLLLRGAGSARINLSPICAIRSDGNSPNPDFHRHRAGPGKLIENLRVDLMTVLQGVDFG